MNEKLKRLLTPEGVKDLLPGPAGQKRALENSIQEIFGRWGYGEVSTPAFEYSANFAGEMKAELEDKVYRFPDERGRTLVLRPDFTLPLARVAATYLVNSPLPLRLCYGGHIYRYANGRQGKQREVMQAGVELIGSACAGADAEVIALAADVLQSLGLADFKLCLGHVGFLESLLDAYEVKPQDRKLITKVFNEKDFVSLRTMVENLAISREAGEAILQVPGLRGGKDVLEQAAALVPTGAADEPLRVLAQVWDMLHDYGATRFAVLDLGLVRMLDYYTGMVFEGYTGGLGYPICGGGRYDQLLEHFGPDMPAVGFALNIDHLLTVLQRQKMLQTPALPLLVSYGEGGRAAAVRSAQALRHEGVAVMVDMQQRTVAQARSEADSLGVHRLLYHDGEDVLEFIPVREGRRKEC